MTKLAEGLASLTALVSCGHNESQPVKTPVWVKEECRQARNKVRRALKEAEGIGDPNLQAAVDSLRRACELGHTEAADVIHALVEDMVEERLPVIPCEEMLDDSHRIPKICGVPDIVTLTEQCGIKTDGPYYGMVADEMAAYSSPGFTEGKAGRRIEALCYEDADGIRYQIVYLIQRVLDEHLQLDRTRFYMTEDSSGVDMNREVMDDQYRRHLASSFIDCPQSEVKKLFRRNRLCPPRSVRR